MGKMADGIFEEISDYEIVILSSKFYYSYDANHGLSLSLSTIVW